MKTVLFFIGALCWGQSFEVASIRPAEPLAIKEVQLAQTGMKISASQVTLRHRSLRDLVAVAYGVELPFVVEDVGWAGAAFDIQAKLPQGSTKDQVPAMIRTLLEERFKLKARRESRTQDVYLLVEAKGGYKMKAASPIPTEEPDPARGFEMPASIRVRGVKETRLGATPTDGVRREWTSITMSELAKHISPMLDRRVVDRTGLAGTYQVSIDVSLEEMAQAMRSNGNAGPNFRLPPPSPGEASEPAGASIPASLKRLGLVLEKGKAQTEIVIVDHIETKPTEN